VVLADDHALVAEGLRRLLEPEFEVVAVVTDGPALLATTERLRPDVVIADLVMPGLSGLEAARRLTQFGTAARVLILTMHAEASLAAAARQAGALGFVPKHAAADELLVAVRTVRRGDVYVSPLVAADPANGAGAGDPPGAGGLLASLGGPRAAGGEGLSPRQREVLGLLAGGLTMKVIGARLGVSTRTVETYKYEAMQRLGVQTTAALIRYAAAVGLVPCPGATPPSPSGNAPGAAPGATDTGAGARRGAPPPRVLLADGHTVVRATVCALLEPEFDVVASVADGPALLDAVRRLRPAAVVTDLDLPGLGGFGAVARLTREIPEAGVVLLTNHAEPGLESAGRSAGVRGYVLKPRAAEELVPALRAALDGRYYVSAAVAPGDG
jgi:DNA-binding NarL/FixJ family response regulator